MKQKFTKTSVSLSQIDRKIVLNFASKNGLNFSSALRAIIRGWDELNSERILITDAGRQALETARADGDG